MAHDLKRIPMPFDATEINGMTLSNRFVRSATWEGLADKDGTCSQTLIEAMAKLAKGGVGLIITGHAYVKSEGQAHPGQLAAYDDRFIPALADMCSSVHKAGGKLVLQIAHAGCQAPADLIGMDPLGPSSMKTLWKSHCRQMSCETIMDVVEAFGKAAARAQAAGFDGVQIHAAHGYLLSQFLSPFFNKREDIYGGSVENRARLVLEVLESIRSSVGGSYPVFIKMNSEDFVEGGLTVQDMLETAAMLERSGIDAIELSGGTAYSGKFNMLRRGKTESEEKEAYYREASIAYKQKIGTPLMLVGGIRSYSVAHKLITKGITDYVSLCRPFIREPGLINRWKNGDTRKSACLSDNLCHKAISEGRGFYCVVERQSDPVPS